MVDALAAWSGAWFGPRPGSSFTSFLVLGDAAAQRLHEIDHPMGRGERRLALRNGAGLLGLEVREQGLLVTVSEGQGVKLCRLALENMLGEREHVRRNGQLRQIAEVILGLAGAVGRSRGGRNTKI